MGFRLWGSGFRASIMNHQVERKIDNEHGKRRHEVL